MIVSLLTVVLLAAPSVTDDCNGLERSLLSARQGDKQAQQYLAARVRRLDLPACKVPELPEELTTERDAWALSSLKIAAETSTNEELARVSLVVWSRLSSSNDWSWLARLMTDVRRESIRKTAMLLLAKEGNVDALALRTRWRSELCSKVVAEGKIGIISGEEHWIDLLTDSPRRIDFVVDHVCPGSRAEAAGLLVEDQLLAVNGMVCRTWSECWEQLSLANQSRSPIMLTVVNVNGVLRVVAVPSK